MCHCYFAGKNTCCIFSDSGRLFHSLVIALGSVLLILCNFRNKHEYKRVLCNGGGGGVRGEEDVARPHGLGGGHHGVGGKLLVEPAILSDFKLIHFQYSALKYARSRLYVDMVARE